MWGVISIDPPPNPIFYDWKPQYKENDVISKNKFFIGNMFKSQFPRGLSMYKLWATRQSFLILSGLIFIINIFLYRLQSVYKTNFTSIYIRVGRFTYFFISDLQVQLAKIVRTILNPREVSGFYFAREHFLIHFSLQSS